MAEENDVSVSSVVMLVITILHVYVAAIIFALKRPKDTSGSKFGPGDVSFFFFGWFRIAKIAAVTDICTVVMTNIMIEFTKKCSP